YADGAIKAPQAGVRGAPRPVAFIIIHEIVRNTLKIEVKKLQFLSDNVLIPATVYQWIRLSHFNTV
ncbi:MAG: hypothetical protein ACPLUL_14110, partial [Thermanaerothrix sp.]|uniref:hypothetical protein n=1 Tax=Thermanaerothrix sp. TaxID=2972675 RepID=UPI003C7A95B1